MREHDYEPVPGLPEEMPEGERVLWQGAPDPWSLTIHGMHIRMIGLYFAVLCAWQVAVTLREGGTHGDAVALVVWFAIIAAVPIAILTLYAWWVARTTLYTVTNKRVVLRIGVAVSTVINLPFSTIEAATLRRRKDGTGNIALSVRGTGRPFFLMLWPHVRPWRFFDSQPAFRCIPDVDKAAEILANALARDAGKQAAQPVAMADGTTAGTKTPGRLEPATG